MSEVTQGVTDSMRIGDVINPKSLNFRFNMVVGDATNFVRAIFYQWHPDNIGLVPGTANILLYNNTTVKRLTSPYTVDQRKNFTVYWDHVFKMDATNPIFSINKTFRKLRKIHFNAGGVTGSNHLYLVMYSDSAAAPDPIVDLTFQLMYQDA